MPAYWKSWEDTPEGFGPETVRLIDYWTKTTLSAEEIADQLGRSKKSVQRKLAELKRHFKSRNEVLLRPTVATPRDDVYEGVPKSSNDKATLEENGNIAVAEPRSKRIKTLEDLLEECKVDLEVWAVDHWIANKWEVGAKNDANELIVEPLWQVKAWLVRKTPIAIAPVVSPVTVNVNIVKHSTKSSPDGLIRGLALPDPQFGFRKSLRTAKLTPFHDRLALDISLQIAADFDFEFVCWLGDFLDLADWSDKFTRDPNFYWTTQPAAIEGKWWMTQHRAANPNARIKLLEGNHEKRLRDQINNHLKEAFGLKSVDALDMPALLSIPRLLALHDLDIEWIADYPNGETWINDFVVCRHGDIARAASGATVQSMVKEANETQIIGHIHRIESATRTIHERNNSRFVSVSSVGCLCRIDGAVPGKKARNNWQQAIGVVDYYLDGRPDHVVTPVPILNGRAIYNGKVYEAQDRTEELREEVLKDYSDGLGWNF